MERFVMAVRSGSAPRGAINKKMAPFGAGLTRRSLSPLRIASQESRSSAQAPRRKTFRGFQSDRVVEEWRAHGADCIRLHAIVCNDNRGSIRPRPAIWGFQFAAHMGFRSSPSCAAREKAPLAKRLGAHHPIDAKAGIPAAALQVLGGAKLILATASDSKSMSDLIAGLAPAGKDDRGRGRGRPD